MELQPELRERTKRQQRGFRFILFFLWSGIALMAELPWTTSAAEPTSTNSTAGHILLNGALGQPVMVPTNAVPANLLPPPHIGLEYQVPQPARGLPVPEAVEQRVQEARKKQTAPEVPTPWPSTRSTSRPNGLCTAPPAAAAPVGSALRSKPRAA